MLDSWKQNTFIKFKEDQKLLLKRHISKDSDLNKYNNVTDIMKWEYLKIKCTQTIKVIVFQKRKEGQQYTSMWMYIIIYLLIRKYTLVSLRLCVCMYK